MSTKIIAEFGVNWKSIKEFEDMVLLCRALGIKHVKMQMWKKEQIPEKLKELRTMYIGPGRAKYCFKFAKKHGIELFYSVFYPEAIDICEKIGVNFYKIRFDDRNDYPLYKRLKRTKKTIFVSCRDPKDTLYFNLANYQKRVNFLYCVPKYPAKIGDYRDLRRLIKYNGISDHTLDLELFKYFYTQRDVRPNMVKWFEMHVKTDDDCFEKAWSKSFKQLKEVLDP